MHVEWEAGGEILADGERVAVVDLSMWRERAEVSIQGEDWVFGKEMGDLHAESGGAVRMQATRRGFFSSAQDITTSAGHVVSVEREGIFSSGWRISADHGEIAVVRSASMWMKRPEADFPDDTPVIDAVFVLWVVYVLMARAQRSAASS